MIKNISYKQIRGKLAYALIYLTSDESSNENVFQKLTRQDIADFSSITIESTVKFLIVFEKEGVVELEGEEIHILKQGELEIISKNG